MRGELAWTCQKRAAWQQKHTKQPCAGQIRPSNPQVGHNPVYFKNELFHARYAAYWRRSIAVCHHLAIQI